MTKLRFRARIAAPPKQEDGHEAETAGCLRVKKIAPESPHDHDSSVLDQ